jgi:hypothetical protein
MNICFFNCNHIGDIFFAQPFILNICKNNPSVTFYYWFYIGHVFFENKCSNLKYLENNICREYKNKLVNIYIVFQKILRDYTTYTYLNIQRLICNNIF